jgi:hypothetical protein
MSPSADSQVARAVLSALRRAGEDVTLSIEGAAVAVSNLDRVYWPGDASSGQPAVTKRAFLRISWAGRRRCSSPCAIGRSRCFAGRKASWGDAY